MQQAPLRKKSDMKLLILYLMDKIAYPLDYVTLNDMTTTDGLIGSFDFTECFAELLDAGNVRELKDENGEDVYLLTEQGERVVESLQGNLLPSIREMVYKSALSMVDFRISGRKIEHSVSRSENGKPVFTGGVSDSHGTLFSVTAELETDEQLTRVVRNWEKRPEAIYKGILAVISGDADYIL
ncbi:MAG: DUF4364 family protein [Clostridia bacterium]|nr:DUF4364 family protein [Clostridia bacterium]